MNQSNEIEDKVYSVKYYAFENNTSRLKDIINNLRRRVKAIKK
jgi:hypothetical protein